MVAKIRKSLSEAVEADLSFGTKGSSGHVTTKPLYPRSFHADEDDLDEAAGDQNSLPFSL